MRQRSRESAAIYKTGLFLLIGLGSGGPVPTFAGSVTAVALTGDQAPHAPVGANFGLFLGAGMGAPVLNDAGQTAFRANLTSATNFTGIWRDEKLVALGGVQAFDAPEGALFSTFDGVVLDDAGQTAYVGHFQHGAGVDSTNDSGIWRDSTLIALEGFRASGLPSDIPFDGFFNPSINGDGHTAYSAFLRETDTNGVTSGNDRGIWVDSMLVAREGSQAPGLADGVLYKDLIITHLSLNDSGKTAYRGVLKPGSGVGTNFNDVGIWFDSNLVAQSGTQAPGVPAGVSFGNLGEPAINNAGQTAFLAGLRNNLGPLDFTSQSGVWRDSTLVALHGAQAPGVPDGGLFSNFDPPVLNDSGQTAFGAHLTHVEGVVDSTNDGGIWRDATLVAREGSHAPGTQDGTQFDEFAPFVLNSKGQVAFMGFLKHGAGDVNFYDDRGIWAENSSGELQLIARKGDALDVGCNETRIIQDLAFAAGSGQAFSAGSANSDGRRSGFNNEGQLVFAASFTDGSQGVFLWNPTDAQPDLQIVIDWKTPLSKEFVVKTDAFTRRQSVIQKNGNASPLEWDDPSEAADFQAEVEDHVCKIFRSSGLDLEILSEPTPDTLSVRFGNDLGPIDRDGNGTPDARLRGIAFDVAPFGFPGIDKFNLRKDGETAVFVKPGTDTFESVAETIAHEAGHGFGLRHINPHAMSAAEVMDYIRSTGDIETFTNVVANIVEPPTPNGFVSATRHNPIYHLRRYAVGEDPRQLLKDGFRAGEWDVDPSEVFALHMGDMITDLPGGQLYNLTAIQSSAHDALEFEQAISTLDFHETIELSDFDGIDFIASAGHSVRLMASSAPGDDWDLFFGFGDAAEPDLDWGLETGGSVDGSVFQFIDGQGFVAIGSFIATVESAGFVTPDGIRATIELTGDFNGDGVVSGSDFLEWQRVDGSPTTLEDWKTHFGTTSASLESQPTATPEPSTAWLMVFGVVGVLMSHRRSFAAVPPPQRHLARIFDLPLC